MVDLPQGHKAIGNKWILKIKRKAEGSIDRYKAQLVAKGIDYKETFSLVVMFTSIHLFLAIVAHMDLELYQMDVNMTFLKG